MSSDALGLRMKSQYEDRTEDDGDCFLDFVPLPAIVANDAVLDVEYWEYEHGEEYGS